MYLNTAKELDKILSNFESGNPINLKIFFLSEAKNKELEYPLFAYIKYLAKMELIEVVPGEISHYRITFDGRVFKGFENEFNEIWRDKNMARKNEKLISRTAFFAALFSGLILILEIHKAYPLFPFFWLY